jgi:hypothetical protein
LDDEYFRGVVSMRHDANNSDAKAAREGFLRSLNMPKKAGLRRSFSAAITQLDVTTPSGLYLGRRAGYNVDLGRLDRVIARTNRGLYFDKLKVRLPADAEVRSWSEDGLRDLDASGRETLQSLLAPLAKSAEQRVGDGSTFRFRFAEASDMKLASAWLLTIYDHTHFFGITVPPGAIGLGRPSAS